MNNMVLRKKEATGAMSYLFMFMTVMVVVIITLYLAQVSKFMTHQHHVDDSLADAVLASLVADDIYYFETYETLGTPIIRFKDKDESYSIFKDCMTNAVAETDGFYYNLKYDTFICYEVDGSHITITEYSSDAGYKHVTSGRVGTERAPTGELVTETSAYGRVRFDIKSIIREDISVRDIKAVMDYLDGRMSVDQLMDEDGLEGDAFEDKNNQGPNLRNEVMDINVERLFDTFLGKLTDVEKFFALIEVGCSEKYETMTVSQFSVDSLFLNMIAADEKYAKIIQVGDVVIKRPNRHSYTDRDVALKDVKYVGGNVVRYQREQSRIRWSKLAAVLSEEDITGNKSVEYFQRKWDELVELYSHCIK